MDEKIKKMIEVHTQRAVCLTYHGCMEHVRFMSLGERSYLAYHLKCDALDLPKAIWNRVRKVKK